MPCASSSGGSPTWLSAADPRPRSHPLRLEVFAPCGRSRPAMTPRPPSRPFDRTRDGFVIAEGGGAFVIEELEHARSRDARIYAELIGYGQSSDAYHMVAPDPAGRGVKLAMIRALADAHVADRKSV